MNEIGACATAANNYHTTEHCSALILFIEILHKEWPAAAQQQTVGLKHVTSAVILVQRSVCCARL